MKRRDFLTGSSVAGFGAALAAPALAQSAPSIVWKLTSSFPTTLDTIWSGAQTFAQAVRDMTDGRFIIELHPAGEIVPPLEVLDAVKAGKADCAQTALFYHWGMQPALVFATGVPFIGRPGHGQFFKELHQLTQRVAGIRRLGSASLDLAWVAAGRYEGYWELGIKPWDIAAGMLIVREAGGYATDAAQGDGDPRETAAIVAANPHMHPKLRQIVIEGMTVPTRL